MSTDRAEHAERSVGTRSIDGSAAKVMTIHRDYPTDQDDLWNALTDAERLARWFLPVTGELRLGGTYQLEGNAGGTVTACDPPRSFAATWEFGGGISWIEVELAPLDPDRTRLMLRHVARPDDHWKLYGPAAVGIGWDLGLRGLEIHLRTGKPNDAAEFEAWCLQPEGRAFIRACGESWYAADVADGGDPVHAREVSERTVAFYSGTAQ